MHAIYWIQSQEGGNHDLEKTIFIGDDIGCCLSIFVVQYLRSSQKHLPSSLVFLCPYIDVTRVSDTQSTWKKNVGYDYLPSENEIIEYLVPLWSQQQNSPNSLSKFFSLLDTDFSVFPPTFIQTSETSQLFGDSENLNTKLKKHGVKSQLRIYSGLPHLFPLFGFLIPQNKTLLDDLQSFVLESTQDK